MTALKVLFLGGSGVISAACVRHALDRGLEVTVVTRGREGRRPLPAGVDRLTADADVPDSLRSAVGGRSFDAVVDWLAFTPDQVRDGHRALPRSHGSVHLHQLGVGLPDAARPGCR